MNVNLTYFILFSLTMLLLMTDILMETIRAAMNITTIGKVYYYPVNVFPYRMLAQTPYSYKVLTV